MKCLNFAINPKQLVVLNILYKSVMFLHFFFVIQSFLLFFHTKTQQLQQLQIT